MTIDRKTNILIVGLGQIGGGYAIGLTNKGYQVDAIARRQETIDFAMDRRMLRQGAAFVDPELVGRADIVVMALYPHILIDWLAENQHLFKPGTLITDVTGVKGCIVDRVQAMLRPDVEFVAAHPMAGRETSGVENATASVFYGANYIVTPTAKNTPENIETCKRLGEILGFGRIAELSPADHDEMIAFLSQLTHCVAVALMTCNEDEHMQSYTGDSFRDLTRIAKINDQMWSELFLLNRDNLLKEMDRFEEEMRKLRRTIEEGDREAMRTMMRAAAQRRVLFDKV